MTLSKQYQETSPAHFKGYLSVVITLNSMVWAGQEIPAKYINVYGLNARPWKHGLKLNMEFVFSLYQLSLQSIFTINYTNKKSSIHISINTVLYLICHLTGCLSCTYFIQDKFTIAIEKYC